MFYVTVGAEELSVDISNWWLSVIHCLLNVAIAIRLFLAVYPFHRLISWNYDHSGTMTFTFTRHFLLRFVSWFLARDPFLRTNRRAIVMMFVRLSVCLSVCLYGTGVHCDHKLHFSADLICGWTVQCSGTLALKHVHLLPSSFSSSTWKRDGVWINVN